MHYKTYCFAFQKRSYHFLTLLSLQNKGNNKGLSIYKRNNKKPL